MVKNITKLLNASEIAVQNICIFNLINYGPDLKAILFLFEKKKCELIDVLTETINTNTVLEYIKSGPKLKLF